MMGDFRPFLGLHTLSVPVLYHSPILDVLQAIALFEVLVIGDSRNYPAKIEDNPTLQPGFYVLSQYIYK